MQMLGKASQVIAAWYFYKTSICFAKEQTADKKSETSAKQMDSHQCSKSHQKQRLELSLLDAQSISESSHQENSLYWCSFSFCTDLLSEIPQGGLGLLSANQISSTCSGIQRAVLKQCPPQLTKPLAFPVCRGWPPVLQSTAIKGLPSKAQRRKTEMGGVFLKPKSQVQPKTGTACY